MKKFLQLHLLTNYGPSNLNRDELGRPKTVVIGNAPRLRISSQSLKRAWRQSATFQESLAGNLGTRTRELGSWLMDAVGEVGDDKKKRDALLKSVIELYGKASGKGTVPRAEQLFFFTPAELEQVRQYAERVAKGDQDALEELKENRFKGTAADIALFGRMLALDKDSAKAKVEAACQVSHAFSTQTVAVEADFLTAVDDRPASGGEDIETGSGFMSVAEYGAGLFYTYICLDRNLLRENLNTDDPLTRATIRALVEAATTVAPTGKQNSYASRAHASFVLAELGNAQPRSLAVAFLSPLESRENLLSQAVEKLQENRSRFAEVYDLPVMREQESYLINTAAGTGRLSELLEFAVKGI